MTMPRMIQLRFSITNLDLVPLQLYGKAPLSSSRSAAPATGKKIFAASENKTTLAGLLGDLLEQSYCMVGAGHKEMDRLKGAGKSVHVMTFNFCRPDAVVGSKPHFEKKREELLKELREICETATWEVEGYENPFHDENGEVREDEVFISIVAKARRPLVNERGEPIKEYPRNEAGQAPGKWPGMRDDPQWAAQPIRPNTQVRLNADSGFEIWAF